ncbi:MAG: molybdenum cofactor guanylyltransferase [Pseudomonadota bacterium]
MPKRVESCSAVILAGGLGTRIGKNKALLSVQGATILDRAYTALRQIFSEIILVSNEPLTYMAWDFMIVRDIYKLRSPLVGIHAGLFYASNPYVFIVGCDMPFLKITLIKTLLAEISPKYGILLPKTADRVQPLCAVYAKKCIKHIEMLIEQKSLKISDLFSLVRVKEIEESRLMSADPGLVSFFNINTPEDLDNAQQMEVEKK